MMKFLRTQMKWIMAVIVVAFLLSTFLMYEGRSTRRTPGRNPDGSMSDYEVAQINGRSLMRSELEQRLRNYLNTYSTRSMTSLDIPALYRTVLNQAILESQLLKEVEDSGIRVTDAEADAAMKNYADTYFPTREAFYQILAQSGIKPDDYKKTLARQMAADRLVRNAIGDVTISEDRAVEFYDTMKNLYYSRPEGFMIHMADFNTSSDAEDFRAMIIAGESWDVIASGDALASMDVINITKTPVFLPTTMFKLGSLSAVDSLDVGQVSHVFEISSSDFAVAMKTSHVDESVTPYDEVSGDIKTLLTQQEETNRRSAYEALLRQKAVVVINDEELFASPAVSDDVTQSDDVPAFTIEDITESEDVTESEPVSEDEAESDDTLPVVTSDEPELDTEALSIVETVSSEAKATSGEPIKAEIIEAVEVETVTVSDEIPSEAEPVKSEDVQAVVEVVENVIETESRDEVTEPEKPETAPTVQEISDDVTELTESSDKQDKTETVSEDKAAR